jgi:hypothetical protein
MAYNKPSTYMILPFSQYLFSIELERSNVKSASELALTYFPLGFHWIPEHPLKSLAFYSNILTQTQSIHIRPIYCQTFVPKKIIYNSVYLNKVISEKRNGVTTFLLCKPFMVSKSLSVIMIMLMLSLNSSCIKLLIWTILGSSVLIKNILEESFLFGFPNGGLVSV